MAVSGSLLSNADTSYGVAPPVSSEKVPQFSNEEAVFYRSRALEGVWRAGLGPFSALSSLDFEAKARTREGKKPFFRL